MIPSIQFITKINKRAYLTVIGIGLAIMFVTSTLILTTSFEESTKYLLSRFETKYYVVDDGNPFVESHVRSVDIMFAGCVLSEITINNTETYFLGIFDPNDLLEKGYNLENDEIWCGYQLEIEAEEINLTSSLGTYNLTVSNTYRSSMFPNNWVIGSVDMARALRGDMCNDSYSFLIIGENVVFEGYRTSNMISILNYFIKSTEEIAYDLIILEIVSIMIIIILVNAIMNMELKENIKNICIMRGLGATPNTIFYIYLLRALYISTVGGLFGLCLGVISSYILVGAVPRLGFETLYAVYVPTIVLIIPFVIALFAGFIGSVVPLWKATKIEPLHGLQGGRS